MSFKHIAIVLLIQIVKEGGTKGGTYFATNARLKMGKVGHRHLR
jgi:hypothetical protein